MGFRSRLSLSLIVALLAVCLCEPVVDGDEKPGASKPATARVRVTVSKETTYITEPLRPDGYPDYAAALNKRFSRGVTPQNNAAVFLWKAAGQCDFRKDVYDVYFRMLGVPPPTGKGNCFTDLEEYAKSRPDAKELLSPVNSPIWLMQYGKTKKSLWTKKEYSFLADWIMKNERSLDIVVEASKCPRLWEPLISHPDPTFQDPDPDFEKVWVWADLFDFSTSASLDSAELTEALRRRATLYAGEGRVDEAWEDIFALLRLGELSKQDPLASFRTDYWYWKERYACIVAQRLLGFENLSAIKAARLQRELVQLPTAPPLSERFDVGLRYACLDLAVMSARQRFSALRKILEKYLITLPDKARKRLKSIDEAHIDWDAVLRGINRWYDRTTSALRMPHQADRIAALKKIEKDRDLILEASKDTAGISNEAFLAAVFFKFIGADIIYKEYQADRWAMEYDLIKLALSLAQYHADHGSYPEKLNDLVPSYLEAIRKDIFNDSDLHYTREGKGYVLYSVGRNGKDDGGKDSAEGGNDIVIRIPDSARNGDKSQ